MQSPDRVQELLDFTIQEPEDDPNILRFAADAPVDTVVQLITQKIWEDAETSSDKHLLKNLFTKHDLD